MIITIIFSGSGFLIVIICFLIVFIWLFDFQIEGTDFFLNKIPEMFSILSTKVIVQSKYDKLFRDKPDPYCGHGPAPCVG